jgi:hypothetical protein
MAIDFNVSHNLSPKLGAKIKVLGVGGGGSNAVNSMVESDLEQVEFMIVNTDAQALDASPVDLKFQIGEKITSADVMFFNHDLNIWRVITSQLEINKIDIPDWLLSYVLRLNQRKYTIMNLFDDTYEYDNIYNSLYSYINEIDTLTYVRNPITAYLTTLTSVCFVNAVKNTQNKYLDIKLNPEVAMYDVIKPVNIKRVNKNIYMSDIIENKILVLKHFEVSIGLPIIYLFKVMNVVKNKIICSPITSFVMSKIDSVRELIELSNVVEYYWPEIGKNWKQIIIERY